MYALATLLGVLAVGAARRIWAGGRRRDAAAYVLLVTAGLYTLYLFAPVWAAINVAWLVGLLWRRKSPLPNPLPRGEGTRNPLPRGEGTGARLSYGERLLAGGLSAAEVGKVEKLFREQVAEQMVGWRSALALVVGEKER